MDIGLWTDAVADMARCLEQPDVDDPQSTAHQRCVQLVALVERVFILKVTRRLIDTKAHMVAVGSSGHTRFLA